VPVPAHDLSQGLGCRFWVSLLPVVAPNSALHRNIGLEIYFVVQGGLDGRKGNHSYEGQLVNTLFRGSLVVQQIPTRA